MLSICIVQNLTLIEYHTITIQRLVQCYISTYKIAEPQVVAASFAVTWKHFLHSLWDQICHICYGNQVMVVAGLSSTWWYFWICFISFLPHYSLVKDKYTRVYALFRPSYKCAHYSYIFIIIIWDRGINLSYCNMLIK